MSTVDEEDEWRSSKRSSSVERDETKRSKMQRDIAMIVCVDKDVTKEQQALIEQTVFRHIARAILPRKIRFINANAYLPEPAAESKESIFMQPAFKQLVSTFAIDYDVMFMSFDNGSKFHNTIVDSISNLLRIDTTNASVCIVGTSKHLVCRMVDIVTLTVHYDDGYKPHPGQMQETIDFVRNFSAPKEFEQLVSTDSVLTRLIAASLLRQSGFSDFNTKGIYDVRLYFYVKHFTGGKHKANLKR